MQTRDIVAKFVEEVRHSIRQELIRELAGTNGVKLEERAPAPHHAKRSQGTKPRRYGGDQRLSPSDVIGLLPCGMEKIRQRFPQADVLATRALLRDLKKQGIVHITGQKRGTVYHLSEPLVRIE